MTRTISTLLACLFSLILTSQLALAGQSLKMTRSYFWWKYVPSQAGTPPIQLPGSPATPFEIDLDDSGQGMWSEFATQDGIDFVMQIDIQRDQKANNYNVIVQVYSPGIIPDSQARVDFHPQDLSKLPAFDLSPSMIKKPDFGIAPVVSFAPVQ